VGFYFYSGVQVCHTQTVGHWHKNRNKWLTYDQLTRRGNVSYFTGLIYIITLAISLIDGRFVKFCEILWQCVNSTTTGKFCSLPQNSVARW